MIMSLKEVLETSAKSHFDILRLWNPVSVNIKYLVALKNKEMFHIIVMFHIHIRVRDLIKSLIVNS